MNSNVRTASTVVIIAGIWLIIAPFILGHAGVSGIAWNEILLGILAIIFASIQLGNTEVKWPSWVNFLIGLWLIAAPHFMRAYTGISSARTNDTILGIIIGLAGLWAALAEPERVVR